MNSTEQNLVQSREMLHLRVENQTLLDQINIMKIQCKTYEEETRKAVDNLACLKLLVRRYGIR
jgi:hypothetical protein